MACLALDSSGWTSSRPYAVLQAVVAYGEAALGRRRRAGVAAVGHDGSPDAFSTTASPPAAGLSRALRAGLQEYALSEEDLDS